MNKNKNEKLLMANHKTPPGVLLYATIMFFLYKVVTHCQHATACM